MSASAAAKHQTLKAIFHMISGMFCFACVDVVIKSVSASLPEGQILFFFGLGTALCFYGVIWRGKLAVWNRHFYHHAVLLRIGGEGVGSACLVFALSGASLSEVTVVLQTVPIIMVGLAILFLKERPSMMRILTLMLGFAGALIVIRPGMHADYFYLLLALIAATGLGVRDMSVRFAPPQISVPALSFIGAVAVTAAGVVLIAIEGRFVALSFVQMLQLLVMAGCAAAGLWSVARCMQLADISATGPFRYSRIIFGVGMGVIFFAEKTDIFILTGSALILAAGLLSWAKETGLSLPSPPTHRDKK